MIPDIGLIIGAYVVTRMIALLARSGDRDDGFVPKFFAVLTILLTVFLCTDLVVRGTTGKSAILQQFDHADQTPTTELGR